MNCKWRQLISLWILVLFVIGLSSVNVYAADVSGTITVNTTWSLSGSPYIVTGDVTVAEGVTLTIAPGVAVQINQYKGLWVKGSLQAVGTSANPITFTGTTAQAGWWECINICESGSAALEWCNISYAGYWDNASVLKSGSGYLSLKNTTITNIGGDGLRILSGYSSFISENNNFSNCNYGVRLRIGTSFDDNTSDFQNNNVDIYVDGGTIAGDVTLWAKPAYSVYVSGDITVAETAELTVKPGTVVKFAQYKGFTVKGKLQAQGTSVLPIYFTDWRDDTVGGDANHDGNTTGPAAGWWEYINVCKSGSAALELCNISYAGYWNNAGVLKSGSGSLSLIQTTVKKTGGHGIKLVDSTGATTFTDSTLLDNDWSGLYMKSGPVTATGCKFTDNGNYGIVQEVNDSLVYADNTFSGNVSGCVGVNAGTLNTDTSWSKGSSAGSFTIAITGDITVAEGVTLTIAPGVTVQFYQYRGLWVKGSLQAVGTSASPITFTGTTAQAGWWRCINIYESGSAAFEWCDISNAGYWDNAGVLKSGSGSLSLKQTTLSNIGGDGLRISTGSTQVVSENNNFSNCNYGVRLCIGTSFDDNTSDFQNNNVDIYVDGGTIAGDVTLCAKSAYSVYVSGDITVAETAELTVKPGTVVKFARYKGFTVEGKLKAQGTSASPIYFTDWRDDTVGGDANHDGNTTEPAAGWWWLIQLNGAGSAKFEWCNISYAGYWDNVGILKTGSGPLSLIQTTVKKTGGHGIKLGESTGATTFTDSTLSDNDWSGLYMNSGSVTATGCKFTDNGNYGIVQEVNDSLVYADNTFSGNVSGCVGVNGGTLNTDTSWSKGSSAGSFTIAITGDITVAEGVTLTIAPGVTVQYNHYKGLWVKGSLQAVGTSASPVTFTGTTAQAGWWQCINIYESGSATFEWCDISNAGYWDNAGVLKSGSGYISLKNTTISNIGGDGLRIDNSSGDNEITKCCFSNNDNGLLVKNQNSDVIVINSKLMANTTYGILNQAIAEVDARSCWWGDLSGPYHETKNPEGQGDKVSDNVLFEPWKLSDISSEIISPIHSGTLVAGDALRFLGSAAADPLTSYVWSFGGGRSSVLQNPGVVSFPDVGVNPVIFAMMLNGELDPSPDTRTYIIVNDTGDFPDLEVSQLNVPASLGVGHTVQVTYRVLNHGDQGLAGTAWTDAIYLSHDSCLDSGDTLLSSVNVTPSVSVNGSYEGSISVVLPAIDEGAYYLILSVDDDWDVVEKHQLNNEYASAVNIKVPGLGVAVDQTTPFTAGQVEDYYRMEVASGGGNLKLVSDAVSLGLEVYIRYGALPTRGSYDYQLQGAELLIPAATGGNWYVLVYGDAVTQSGSYHIRFEIVDLELLEVAPTRYGTTTPLNMALTGVGFTAPVSVDLLNEGGTVFAADTVEVDSFTEITANFAAGVIPPGLYTVRVTGANGSSDELSAVLEVIAGGKGKLETKLVLPERFGYHQLATVYVEYANVGDASMPAPILIVTATQNDRQGAIITLDKTRISSGFWTSVMPEGFSHKIQFLASGETPGVLQPGESKRVPVYYAGWQKPWDFAYPPFEWEVKVIDENNSSPVGWEKLKDEMRPDYIRADAWDVVWNNFVSLAGSTWGDYVAMLSRNAFYLHRIGQNVSDISYLLALTFRQADAYSPLSSLSTSVDAVVEAPGIPIVFDRYCAQPISRRFVLGPLGRSWTHNWQYDLTVKEDDTVVITDLTGTPRIFQPDSRYSGSYLGQTGDRGVLRFSSETGYILTETTGLVRAFSLDGKLKYVEDKNNNRITCSYSGGMLVELSHSSGQFLKITYNNGLISSVTDHLDRQTLYNYAGEYLVSVQAINGQITTYDYDTSVGSAALHALKVLGRPDGTRHFYTYNDKGYLRSLYRDDNAEKITFSYNIGRVSLVDAPGNVSRFYFDYAGRMVKGENPFGETVQMSFDEFGNLAKITDSAGINTSFSYDRKGNLVELCDAMRQKTTFTSSHSRMSSLTDAKGNRFAYDYDGRGNLVSIIYPDGSVVKLSYDVYGKLDCRTNRRQNDVTYSYDSCGRIIGKTYVDGSIVTYSYDAHGNMIKAENAQGSTRFTFDGKDQVSRIDYPGNRYLIFTYDTAGRRQSIVDQLGCQVNYEYDAAGRLARLSDGDGVEIVSYKYDELGRLVEKMMGNGVYVRYAYDAAGRLLTLLNCKATGEELSHFNYTYDRRGRRISMATGYGSWNYTYDDLGQLIRAVLVSTDSKIASLDLSYEYDVLGNRIKTTENSKVINYKSNLLNQIIEDGDSVYVYDDDGNLAQKVTAGVVTNYAYDDENQLLSITKGDDIRKYSYDAFGNRVSVNENGIITHFVVDPAGFGDVVGVYNDDGTLVNRYFYGFGLLKQESPSGVVDFYTFDPVGNSCELTDSSGNLHNSYIMDPFGKSLFNDQNTPNPFQFMGEYGVMQDSSGLNYARARYYDAASGRFTQMDPIGLAGGDFNFYRYVNNSPLNFIDPEGLLRTCQAVKGFFRGVGGALTAAGGGLLAATGYGLPLGGPMVIMGGEDLGKSILMIGNAFEDRKYDPPSSFERVFGAKTELGKNVVDAVDGNPIGLMESGTGWFCGWSTKPVIQPTTTTSTIAITASSGTVGSQDPNQKLTIAGYGTANYVSGDALLSYRVDFENDAQATAPAQVVFINDTLSSNLDWSTFELTEVGFGSEMITLPEGTKYFTKVVSYPYRDADYDMDIEVHIEAGIRSETGEVFVNFTSIDPATGLPPAVNSGFLPPENDTGRGRGYFSYLVKPKGGLASGTEIRNIAAIQFDFSETINTNQVAPHDPGQGTDPEKEALVTIDVTSPVSTVASLADTNSLDFTVAWGGNDDHSGIGSYTIYVQDNGGPFTAWKTTSETSAVFSGEEGHRYGFYSIVKDNVGNQEVAKTVAETSTTLVASLDSDGDGIPDDIEQLSPCLDPYDADTDNDGIIDGIEDANHNGIVDFGESSPCMIDSDSDGLQDGTESGYSLANIGADTDSGIFQPDLDPYTLTDPLSSDSDYDGFLDGEEDANHNGRVDAGEDDPLQACLIDNVRIDGSPATFFAYIQSAYDAAQDGEILELHAVNFTEELIFDRDLSIILKPGFLCDYTVEPSGVTTIKGSLKFTEGTTTISEGCLELGR